MPVNLLEYLDPKNLGIDGACANGGYQAAFPLSQRPGFEARAIGE